MADTPAIERTAPEKTAERAPSLERNAMGWLLFGSATKTGQEISLDTRARPLIMSPHARWVQNRYALSRMGLRYFRRASRYDHQAKSGRRRAGGGHEWLGDVFDSQ